MTGRTRMVRQQAALAARRAGLAALLVWRRLLPPAEIPPDRAEQQRAWREHALAAERFHALVIEERGRQGG